MTSQPGWQIITKHILPNISQSKRKQTMNFGKVIDYNKINIFLQKLCKKWSREASSSRPFYVSLKLWIKGKKPGS